jgi:hypothetical protein
MNKPEAKPAQSLEEILASIRKALAEEEVQGAPEAPASAEPARPADKKSPSPAKSDPLSGQLAVALNGSRSEENATDDDLADLLAPLPSDAVPSKAASAAPEDAEPSPPSSGSGDKKDPLWFLARKDVPEVEPAEDVAKVADKPGDREEATAKAEEITLTRLETLRASLPPLFGGEEAAVVKAEPVSYAKPASTPKPAERPAVAPPEKAKEEKPEIKASPAEKMLPPEKAPAAQVMGPEPPTQGPMPPPPGGVLQPPGGSSAPASEVVMVSGLAEARGSAANASPLGSSAQARALEEMIGQLIGPVIHSWLDANLSRLVEKVVREEVARTVGNKADVGKD